MKVINNSHGVCGRVFWSRWRRCLRRRRDLGGTGSVESVINDTGGSGGHMGPTTTCSLVHRANLYRVSWRDLWDIKLFCNWQIEYTVGLIAKNIYCYEIRKFLFAWHDTCMRQTSSCRTLNCNTLLWMKTDLAVFRRVYRFYLDLDELHTF